MGLLDGSVSRLMYGIFGAIYLPATLYRPVTVDVDGSITRTGVAESVRVQVDAVTESQRASPSFAATDVRLLILAQGVKQITSDCWIDIGGKVYGIASPISTDPAGAYYDCRGVLR